MLRKDSVHINTDPDEDPDEVTGTRTVLFRSYTYVAFAHVIDPFAHTLLDALSLSSVQAVLVVGRVDILKSIVLWHRCV